MLGARAPKVPRPARGTPIAADDRGALRRIAELYLVAAEIRGKPPDKRRLVRQTRARSLLDDLQQWLRIDGAGRTLTD